MCGIAGELRFKDKEPSLTGVIKANKKQYSRGQDGEGIFHTDAVTLGHRRLKIFDLSRKGAQPMVDQTLGLALVFNGAIYNFRELRQELEGKGYRFTSSSDTEVLMKAWHAWGAACVERLCGMFAFAIWEQESGKLMLVRDRLGIKPLYYAQTADSFCFASTLPAVLEFEGVDKSIHAQALHYYMTFHAVPEPFTILAGVKKLMPATILTLYPSGQQSEQRYWSFQLSDNTTRPPKDEAHWLQETKKALELAVERQLAADVPVGILLSGGLDSSLLVALAAQRGQKIESFSIGFESANGEEGDEFYYSDRVAQHFGTRHHQLSISNHALADFLPECVKAMSEPMPSHDNIGFFLLSREVAKHVTVVLSGQGADEMFGGYHWFQKFAGLKATPTESAQLLLPTLSDHSFEEYQSVVTPRYRTSHYAKAFLDTLCAHNNSPSPINPLLEYESTFALANGPLLRVDSMTMASSLEARVPFLDEAVVNSALELPLTMKLPDGGKYILKQLGRTLLPREIVDRPKGYFPVPVLKYMQGKPLELMREVLSPKNVKQRGIFDPTHIETLLSEPDKHQTPSGASKLWQLGLLEFWLQQQGI